MTKWLDNICFSKARKSRERQTEAAYQAAQRELHRRKKTMESRLRLEQTVEHMRNVKNHDV